MKYKRTVLQKIVDFLTFPIRALTIFHEDKFGLSSLATERFDQVAKHVNGYCLDIGCGKNNMFIKKFLNNEGVGLDLFPYEGLTDENLVENFKSFPFKNESFDSVTFIANINHVPKLDRDIELRESYRVLKYKGNIIVTMGNPIAEIIVHKLLFYYDKILKTKLDMDTERGMEDSEEYFLRDKEIKSRLFNAGFKNIEKNYFVTQWGLNHLFVAWKI